MNKRNLDIISKILILISFAVFYLKLIITNEIILYVHPRMIPFSIFGMIVMIIIAMFLITSKFKNNNTRFKFKNYVPFIIPLIIILLFENTAQKSSAKTSNINTSATASDYKLYDNNSKSNNESIGTQSNNQLEIYSGKTATYNTDNNIQNKLNISNNIIEINSKNYVSSLDEIINNCDKYEGKEIEITGFIYRDKNLDLKENQFIIARYMMVCCAADMQVAGLRCQLDNAQNIPDLKEWVKIKGKIKNDTYEGVSDPLILIEQIEIDNTPDTSYVYPY